MQTQLPQKRQKAKINTTISDERWPSLIGAIKIPVLKEERAGLSPGICSHRSEQCSIQEKKKKPVNSSGSAKCIFYYSVVWLPVP